MPIQIKQSNMSTQIVPIINYAKEKFEMLICLQCCTSPKNDVQLDLCEPDDPVK